jgi:hypothetical protein
MAYNREDQPSSTLGSYEDINNYYEAEINVVRMENSFDLKKDSDGTLYFQKEMRRWGTQALRNQKNDPTNDNDEAVYKETVITYHTDGEIVIDIPPKKNGYSSYQYNNDWGTMLSYLPSNVGMYETSSNDKKYLLYDNFNVRTHTYYPTKVWDITKSKSIRLKPDGRVIGAKEVNRGVKKFADDKPLDKQLEEKHLREMTKARLQSDLEIDYNSLSATFRGNPTGTHHYCLEMYMPSKYGASGPNDGLIRRIFVGRFIDRTHSDKDKCTKLALSIIKDIPDNCLSDGLVRLREDFNKQ